MEPIWIACVEVLAYIDAAPTEGKLGFINVIAAVNDPMAVEKKVVAVLKEYQWEVIGFESISEVDPDSDYQDDILELIEKVRAKPHFVLLSTLYSYKTN